MTAATLALVDDYIEMRRGLGYRSRTRERALRSFARYVDQQGHVGPDTGGVDAALGDRGRVG
jgi:hypothetical protein